MTKKLPDDVTADDIWNAYMVRVHVDAGVDVKNFLGSVAKHKKLFDKAIEDLEKQHGDD